MRSLLLATILLCACSIDPSRSCTEMYCADSARAVFASTTGPLPAGTYLLTLSGKGATARVTCRVEAASAPGACDGGFKQTLKDGRVIGFEGQSDIVIERVSIAYGGNEVVTTSGAPEVVVNEINGPGCPGACKVTTWRASFAAPAPCAGC
jgi:hypothetical protein